MVPGFLLSPEFHRNHVPSGVRGPQWKGPMLFVRRASVGVPQEFKTNRGRVADETPQKKRLLVVLVPPGGSPLPTAVPKAVNMPQGACADPKAAGGKDRSHGFHLCTCACMYIKFCLLDVVSGHCILPRSHDCHMVIEMCKGDNSSILVTCYSLWCLIMCSYWWLPGFNSTIPRKNKQVILNHSCREP